MKKVISKKEEPLIKKLDDAKVQNSIELSLSNLLYPTFKTRSTIDPKSLNNLSVNIEQVGLLNPVIVREKGEKWEIISGVKRVMVYQKLGRDKIPSVVYSDIDDKQALIISLSDNLNRDDLNVFDQVYSFLQLMGLHLGKPEEEVKAILNRIDNFDKGKLQELTPEDQAAEKVIEAILGNFGRIKIGTFILKMRLMSVHPLLKEAVRDKGLHYTFALEINRVKDEEKMKELLSRVFDNNLGQKELRDEVQKILGITAKPNPFVLIYKKAKDFYHLPEDKQKTIQLKIQEIQSLMAG
jgi:ParB/RepB/Spo0J family partition protein